MPSLRKDPRSSSKELFSLLNFCMLIKFYSTFTTIPHFEEKVHLFKWEKCISKKGLLFCVKKPFSCEMSVFILQECIQYDCTLFQECSIGSIFWHRRCWYATMEAGIVVVFCMGHGVPMFMERN